MVNIGESPIKDLFVGDMGIKYIQMGEENQYTRLGGYLYLELKTKEEEN